MSQENVKWVRGVAEVWTGRWTEAAEALVRPRLAPGFEIHPLYLERTYKGVEGIRQLWADIDEIWQDYRLAFGEIVDLGEHVLALAHITARGSGSGVPIDEEIAVLWAFEGDKAVRMKSFMSKREAIEAAGLRE